MVYNQLFIQYCIALFMLVWTLKYIFIYISNNYFDTSAVLNVPILKKKLNKGKKKQIYVEDYINLMEYGRQTWF